MKRILALTTATLMGASIFAAPALAQTAPGAETGTGQTDVLESAPDTATDPVTDTMEGDVTAMDEPSFDSAIGAIEGGDASTAALGTMTETGDVQIVRVNELPDADETALETATEANSAGITELQAAIDANDEVSQALADEDVSSSDVVGLELAANGELVVYVN